MPAIRYVEEYRPSAQTKVRTRFSRDLEALTVLGFRELCFYREQFGLFSTILGVPMSLLMLAKREVMSLDRRLQVSASFVLMYHNAPSTVVVPLGLGVKLYTTFTDRTVLISTNFPSCMVSADSGTNVLKYASTMTVGDVWARHQERIRDLGSAGKIISRSIRFDHYVEMSRQEEAAFG